MTYCMTSYMDTIQALPCFVVTVDNRSWAGFAPCLFYLESNATPHMSMLSTQINWVAFESIAIVNRVQNLKRELCQFPKPDSCNMLHCDSSGNIEVAVAVPGLSTEKSCISQPTPPCPFPDTADEKKMLHRMQQWKTSRNVLVESCETSSQVGITRTGYKQPWEFFISLKRIGNDQFDCVLALASSHHRRFVSTSATRRPGTKDGSVRIGTASCCIKRPRRQVASTEKWRLFIEIAKKTETAAVQKVELKFYCWSYLME